MKRDKVRTKGFGIDRTAWAAGLALVAVLLLAEFTGLDLWVQDRFYNFETHTWLVDAKAFWPRLFFYTGPKAVLIALGMGALVLALGRTRWRKALSRPPVRRRDLLVMVAVLVSGPALVALCKMTTNVFCPFEVRRYGGDVPYVGVCSSYPAGDQPARQGRGFPAGHASGGFALLSLAGLARTPRWRTRGLLAGLAAGGLMGGYQMLKGAHYLSHTLITLALTWLVFLAWRRLLGATDREDDEWMGKETGAEDLPRTAGGAKLAASHENPDRRG